MKAPSLTRQALRISTIEGTWASVHFVLTSGVFFTGFALMLGATDFQLGLLFAIPLLAQVFQIPGGYLIERTGHRRLLVGWFSVVSRTFWLPIALAPFVVSRDDAILAFLVLYLLSSVSMNWAGAGWVAWMSALVPEAIRGRYFGMRNRITGVVTIGVSLAAGFAIDAFKRHGHEPAAYLLLQMVAVVAGLMAFRLILRQPDPGYRAEVLPSLRDYLSRPMRDPMFRRIAVFQLYWMFAVSVASPFFNAHLLKYMSWSYKSLALNGVIFSITAILSQPFWGRMADRHGNKPVLMITGGGIILLPFFYAFCPWDLKWPIFANALLGGVVWAGFGLAAFNQILQHLPASGRSIYVAVLAAANGVMTFLACTLSGWMAEKMAGFRLQVLGLSVVHYQVLFILTGLLRIPGLVLLRQVREDRARGTVEVLRRLFIEFNRRVGLGRHIFPYP